jgi:hypothetical protein
MLLAALAFLPSASGKTKINWKDAEGYRDASVSDHRASEKDRKIVLDDLEEYFKSKAESHFGGEMTLILTVTELDLAGDFESWRGPEYDDIRIIRQIYPALIEFEYILKDAEGEVLAEGSETLRHDLFARPFNSSRESYPYVKEIVHDWMSRLAREHLGS